MVFSRPIFAENGRNERAGMKKARQGRAKILFLFIKYAKCVDCRCCRVVMLNSVLSIVYWLMSCDIQNVFENFNSNGKTEKIVNLSVNSTQADSRRLKLLGPIILAL